MSYLDVTVTFALSLGARVDVVVSHFNNKAAAARMAGISVGDLVSIIEGVLSPHAITLSRLACAASIDLNWLLTGEGERSRSWPSDVALGLWTEGAK